MTQDRLAGEARRAKLGNEEASVRAVARDCQGEPQGARASQRSTAVDAADIPF
jgi:hypothetical protein